MSHVYGEIFQEQVHESCVYGEIFQEQANISSRAKGSVIIQSDSVISCYIT